MQRALRAAIGPIYLDYEVIDSEIYQPSVRLPVDWHWQRLRGRPIGGPGFVPLNSTSNHTTRASTRRGSGQDRSKWRQLVETAMLIEGLIMMMLM